ncbi:protein Gawky isoform X1 [Drosophila albomicans]|uniref:Protein Gawky isoform X1 n=1 Tax=Drosophila albomicans TaxID=7291 RepID=A0A6P8X733_DROAB|nr:protein Gawky isoform X1 [Drosophila albomicans]XP_051862229.1 protein Gawky isoform X1 [Drosophila albomicans]
MREALFSQDGWGCQHVNQDTNWEVPSSPEPTNKDQSGGPPIWKPNINNGTDLWESNLRNGGQPPAQQVPKPSWGHTPSSNLGGTWGEDDDGADTSSVWTGQSTGNTSASAGTTVVGVNAASVGPSASGPQWGQNVVGVGVNVGLGSSGNNSSATSGTLPAVSAGCGSGGNNITAPGTVGGNVGNGGNGWGDPREIRPLGGGGGPMDIRNVDPRADTIAMRGVGAGPSGGDPRDLRMIDPRDPIRGDPRGISGRLNGTSEMWGHHQPMAHNQQLQSQINKMVGSGVGAAGGNVTSSNLVAGAVSSNLGGQWGSAQAVVGGPKDMTKQISGWEEPSPPPQRRNLPNYDDGTSLWGQQQARVPGGGGSSAHWKDMNETMGRSHLMRTQSSSGTVNANNVPVGGNPNNPMTSVVGPQTRLASAIGGPSGQHGKPDATAMWVHPSGNVANRNSSAANSWGEDGHVGNSGNNWIDDKSSTAISQIAANSSSSWNDSPGGWGKQQTKLSTNATTGWNNANATAGNVDGADLTSDWPHGTGLVNKTQQQQQQQKQLGGINVNVLSTEMVKQSKQFRILVENGFKKDDVERALLSANMNIEEAAEMLRANANSSSLAMETGWRRHDETLASYADHSNATSSGGFPPQRYPVGGGAQPSMSFPPNNLLANMSGTGVAGTNNPNMAALQVQKYLNQGVGPHNVSVGGGPQSVNVNAANASVAFCQQNASNAMSAPATVNITSNANNQPSGQHIRMLGQQIQLAIHSGFISSQILTQPLTQTTLNLLNQLLSNIKHLQAAQQSLSRGSNANPMAVNVAIAKYKQQIQTLQNQINAQQAVYLKQQNSQQQQSQHSSGHLNNVSNDYLRNHDAIATLQGNFSELNLNKQSGYQGAPNQQSRLNQWKLPVLEKDSIAPDNTDFSRAPGTTKQTLSSNSNNMGTLGLQNDGTWSTGRCIGDGWPDTSNDNENKDWTVASTAAAAYTDLVQEFEPGKPWKGSQIKSIEDDPSITPGSVARSPLSINPTPKDADIFANTAGKSSPTELPPLSLSSSTWSFNPNQNFPSWSDNAQQCATSELWTSSLNKSASRGPPPGLSTNKSGGVGVTTATTVSSSAIAGSSNGWLPNRGIPNTNTTWTAANTSWNSSWLLLKNLNAQIDGSTLRTLCMQHGPLISFHQYLNQGVALCKYTTREEANKAQMALNNCVLGNTTIYAESPGDNEVQNILQHLPPQAPSSTNSTITSNGSGISASNSSVGSGTNSNSATSSTSSSSNASNTASNSNSANGTVVSIASPPAVVGAVASSAASISNSNSSNINNVNSTSVNGTVNNGNNSATKNSSSGGNNPTMASGHANVSTVSAAGNNSTWRQAPPTQNQALQQGVNRPPGREADYDYISQFVCSIVDD